MASAKLSLHRAFPNNPFWSKAAVNIYYFKWDPEKLEFETVHLVGLLAEANNDATHYQRESYWFERVLYARRRFKFQKNSIPHEVKKIVI